MPIEAIARATGVDAALEERIRVEFSEMPGLKLTLPQACKLFSVERCRCERALDDLVHEGALFSLAGMFVRSDSVGKFLTSRVANARS
jgi:hypothetical protein